MKNNNIIIGKWSVLGRSSKQDRYIWLNRDVWWCSLTLVSDDGLYSRRARFSLKTRDVEEARRRRDRVIAGINGYRGMLAV